MVSLLLPCFGISSLLALGSLLCFLKASCWAGTEEEEEEEEEEEKEEECRRNALWSSSREVM